MDTRGPEITLVPDELRRPPPAPENSAASCAAPSAAVADQVQAPPAPRSSAESDELTSKSSFIVRAFGITALLSAGGSLLGLLRDLLLARYYGADEGTDAFLVAWTVPETASPLLIEDAMAFLMVPAFSLALAARHGRADSGAEGQDRPGPDPVLALVSATLPWLLLGLAALSAVTALGAPQLVQLLAPGLPDPALAISCTRLTALTVLPFGVTGYLAAALRAHHSFPAPAGIYIAYNLAILAALVTGHNSLGVRAAALGVALGGVAMSALLVPSFVRHLRAAPRGPRTGGVRSTGLLLSPLTLLPVVAFSLTRQAQVFIERYLGSGLAPGSISHLNYASKVSQLAMTAAILICTITFPLVARAMARGDLLAARDRVEKDLGQVAAVVLLGTAFLVSCAPAVVSLLFQRGAFSAQDTAATAGVIRVYSLGLLAQALTGAMIRPYFSARPAVRIEGTPDPVGGTRKILDWFPVLAMAVGLLVTAVVGVLAAPRYGALGLAAGNAAGITTTAVLLMRGLLLRGIALRLPRVLGGQLRLVVAAACATGAGLLVAPLASAVPLAGLALGVLAVVTVFAVVGSALGAVEVVTPVRLLVRALRLPGATHGGK